MSDLVGNPEDRFSRVKAHMIFVELLNVADTSICVNISSYGPVREKTNNLGSDQVRHKPCCSDTEAGWKLKISDLRRRGIVLSV